ncbi:hypothetical protein LWI28_024277 [Acer negundo]|uniref:Uncharacterized protein n=1 Tax=Acer negundo TaxID=4023 RepID=A0AAD5JEG9_ACENE|nr:hypothetical protein LWI28_024277 [Acer negundo]
MEGKNPIKVIKEAISRTLVFYYPLDGRLREGFNRKLMVDYTDEVALEIDPDEIVRVSCTVKVRDKNYNMCLTHRYYGNAFANPTVCSKAYLLCENPLEYAAELVKKVKTKMSEEYIRSLADLMVIR